MQSQYAVTIQKRGDTIQRYELREKEDLAAGDDIIGLDANVLVDLVESDEFKQNIREQVSIGVWKIYTTNVALGEAKHVLMKKRRYSLHDATHKLQNILLYINYKRV